MKTVEFHIATTVHFISVHKIDATTGTFYKNSKDEYRLIISKSCSLAFLLNDMPKSLKQCEVYLTMPEDTIQIETGTSLDGVFMLVFQYKGLVDEDRTPILLYAKAYIDDRKFYDLLDEIIDEVKYDIFNHKPRLNILLSSLLLALGRYCRQIEFHEKDFFSYKRSSTYVKKVIDFLECNIHNVIDGVDIERQLELNYDYINTIFKQSVGMTIKQYLEALKIRTAKDLLLHTNLKVNEIARMVGIFDSQYFSRKFRAVTGIPPLKYRQRGEL
jgi:AraC-like DNA-binding protein